MKRIIVLVMAVVFAVSLASCGETATVDTGEKKISVGTIEELQALVEQDVENTAADLRTDYESLLAEVDTYDKYVENIDQVEEFYGEVYNETREICIRMREYSICYAEIVIDSNASNEDKYDLMGEMYDCIYDDACGDIYDAIYEDLLGDVYDTLYDEIVGDGYDSAPYDEWYDTASDAYDMWSDCLSDVYDEWSDALSDIYGFYSDVYGEMWDADIAGAREEIDEFNEDIEDLKADE